ncbi:hypothetical protein [Mycolicibacterium septicum]|nr:hypothetical protein [Mycolicibacterium septicum]QRY51833.1 hypothetical protein JVX95_31415 [Mycolicibacterium septicum]
MTIDQAAAILYAKFHHDGYGRDYQSATDKPRWRAAASALMQALEES